MTERLVKAEGWACPSSRTPKAEGSPLLEMLRFSLHRLRFLESAESERDTCAIVGSCTHRKGDPSSRLRRSVGMTDAALHARRRSVTRGFVASECDSQTGVSVPLRESPAARGALRQLRAPLSLRPRSIAYECDHRQEYRFHCKCKRTGTSAGSSAFTASLLRAGCQHLPWALPSAAGRGSRAQRAR